MEIAIALVVIAAALAVLFVLLAAKKEIIKIGAIVSFSGPGSYEAEEVREGMLHNIDFPLHPAHIVEGEVKYLRQRREGKRWMRKRGS